MPMEIQNLDLSLVFPSPMNPRKTFDEDSLVELADSIEKQGLHQPVTVRPKMLDPDEPVIAGYEIVCGERRYRAYRILSERWEVLDTVAPAGHTYNRFGRIPAIVREMSDEEAFEAMITENLQRQDVNPMEEAYAFGQLIERGKTAEEVAAKFGKSIRFIQDRVKLNNLIPELGVAVKEDKMSISAAMIICKLDADDQREFFRAYGNMANVTRKTAENFVDNYFMQIDKALWCQDFEGSCGRRCDACLMNTANAGCLFWEMKTNGLGKCTSASQFRDKQISWQISRLEEIDDVLVKKGEPMVYGKVVIDLSIDKYDLEEVREHKARLLSAIEAKGWAVVRANDVFGGKCWYKQEDERVTKGLQDGSLYRVMRLFNYVTPVCEESYYWVRSTSMSVSDKELTKEQKEMPVEVVKLLERLDAENRTCESKKATKGVEALSKCEAYSSEPLHDFEQELMLAFMLLDSSQLCKTIGIATGDIYDIRRIYKFVCSHREKWESIKHGWICQRMHGNNSCLLAGSGYISELAELHGCEDYHSSMRKIESRHKKAVENIEKSLKEFGYNTKGEKI